MIFIVEIGITNRSPIIYRYRGGGQILPLTSNTLIICGLKSTQQGPDIFVMNSIMCLEINLLDCSRTPRIR